MSYPMSDNANLLEKLEGKVAVAESRRAFLRNAAISTVAAGALAACGRVNAESPPQGNASGGTMPEHGPSTAATTAAPAAPAPPTVEQLRASADAMDAMHEKVMQAFPAPTSGKGNQVITPRIEKGVKIYELTAREIDWETEPGKKVKAWAYNDQVPGPQIRAREGERVRIVLKNELPESTSIHFHGLEIPNDQDGVTFMTQPPIKPGETYTYEFIVPNSGSHMYHSHHDSAKQVGMGLLGAFIVEPKRKRAIEHADVDYVMILNDGYHGYTLNGKGFPATEPIKAKVGQRVRIRYMNEGMMIHPMHLHGMHMTVIDKDGWPQPQPWKCDTLNIAPGERWDVIVNCTNPGSWAFHCHILPHAESEHGMYGMVTALIVENPVV
jgi:FtsP/CotA-like multicopper oxidase with cupredoxin domain